MKLAAILIAVFLAIVSCSSISSCKLTDNVDPGRYSAIAATIERHLTPSNRKLLRLNSYNSATSSLKSVARAIYKSAMNRSFSVSVLSLASAIPKTKASSQNKQRNDAVKGEDHEHLDPPDGNTSKSDQKGKCLNGKWHDNACYCKSGCKEPTGVCSLQHKGCAVPHLSSGSGALKVKGSAVAALVALFGVVVAII